MIRKLGFLLLLVAIKLLAYAILDFIILINFIKSQDYRFNISSLITDILFIAYIIKYYYPQGLSLKKVFKKIHYILVIKYTFLFFLVVYFPYLFIIHFYYGGGIFFSPMNLTNYSLFFLVNALLVVPFVEEFFYRKFVFDYLNSRMPILYIGLFSSLLFSSTHFFGHHLYLLSLFILGGLSFYVYSKTKNLTISFYLHFLYNLSSHLFTWEYL